MRPWDAQDEMPGTNVIRFPVTRAARPGSVAVRRRAQPKRGILRQWLRRRLFRARIPGAIQEIELRDSATGQWLSIWVGEYYVRLCVDGRDYYFDRLTGRFDGMGAVR